MCGIERWAFVPAKQKEKAENKREEKSFFQKESGEVFTDCGNVGETWMNEL